MGDDRVGDLSFEEGGDLNETAQSYDDIAAEEHTENKARFKKNGSSRSVGKKGLRKKGATHDVPSMFTPLSVSSTGTPGKQHINRYSDRVGYETKATMKPPLSKHASLQKLNDASRGSTPGAGAASLRLTSASRQDMVNASPFGPSQKPAPNSYTPKHSLTKPRRAQYSFGSDERMRHMGYTGHESTGPGPGAYFPTTTFMSRVRRGPGAPFPTETRRISENWTKKGAKKTQTELRDQAVRMMTAGPRDFEKKLERLKKRRDKEDRRILEGKRPGSAPPSRPRNAAEEERRRRMEEMDMSSSFTYVGVSSRATDRSTYTYQPRPKSNTPYSEYYQEPDSPLRTGESFRDRSTTGEIQKKFYRASQGGPPPDAYNPRITFTRPAAKSITMGSEDRYKHLGFMGHESTGPGPGQYFPTHSFSSNYRRAATHAMPTQSRPISEEWSMKKKGKKARPHSADPTVASLENFRDHVLNDTGLDTTGELDAEVAGIQRPQSAGGSVRKSKQPSTLHGDWLEPYKEVGERRREHQLDDYHKQFISSSDVQKSESFSYLSSGVPEAKPTEGAQTVLQSKIEQPPPTAYNPSYNYIKDKTLNTVFPKDDRHKYLGSTPHPGPGPGAYNPIDRFSSRKPRLGGAQFLTETRPISEDWQRPSGLKKGNKGTSSRSIGGTPKSSRPGSAPPQKRAPKRDPELEYVDRDVVQMTGSLTIENEAPLRMVVAFKYDVDEKEVSEVLLNGDIPASFKFTAADEPTLAVTTAEGMVLAGKWHGGLWKGKASKDGDVVGEFALMEDQ